MANFYAEYPFEGGGGGGGGTVTSVSVVSANGIDGTVANPTTTPAITLGTTLTAGSVVYSNGTGFAQDNANFFWDDTDHFLGIGTNAPLSNLSVNGSASIGTFSNTNASPTDGLAVSGQAIFGGYTDPDPGDPSGPHQVVIIGEDFANILEVTNNTFDNAFIVYPLSNYNMQIGSRYNQSFSIITNNGDAGATFYQNYSMSIGTDYSMNFFPGFVPANSLAIEGSLGVGTNTPAEIFEVVGNTRTQHIVGSTTTPMAITSDGAGAGATVSITGSDLAGLVVVNTGTGCTTDDIVFLIAYTNAYGTPPYCTLTPANAATAALGTASVFVESNTMYLIVFSNSTALTDGSSYSWFYQVIQ